MRIMRVATKKELKTIKRLFEQHTLEELADAFVFPIRPDDLEQAEKDLAELHAMRHRQIANRTPEGEKYGKMLQIKYQIRSRIDDNDYEAHWNFRYFLNEYIRIQEKRQGIR